MDDFREEVPGYLGNDAMARRLATLSLASGAEALPDSMSRCYEALIEGGWVGAGERPLLAAWLRDVAARSARGA